MASCCARQVAAKLFALVLLSVVVSHFCQGAVRYDGFRLLRIIPRTHQHIEDLLKITSTMDVWAEPRNPGDGVDVMVGPDQEQLFRKLLDSHGLHAEVLIQDVQTLIEQPSEPSQVLQEENASPSPSPSPALFELDRYQTLENIHTFLKETAIRFPNISSIISAGKSAEGRELLGVRIAHKQKRPIVFVEAGAHAKEWISLATATWIVDQVINTNVDLVKDFEWHIFPAVNPDGYVYTHTEDRFWRKNRNVTSVPVCIGVDIDRNYPTEWRVREGPCNDDYSGQDKVTVPETRGLVPYIKAIANNTRVYISLHSYKQRLLYPYAYTDKPTAKNARFEEIAKKAVAKLATRFGTQYTFGTVATKYVKQFGTALDYAFNVSIPYAFLFELRDKGKYGMALPANQIVPTSQETFDAITVILEEAAKSSGK